MDAAVPNPADGAPKEFKMPSLEDFQKFIDKMEVSDEEKEELVKAFTGNKDKIFHPGFDPAEAARQAMRKTMFQAGGFSGPNYLYFFVTVILLATLLGKKNTNYVERLEFSTTWTAKYHIGERRGQAKFNVR